MTVEERRARLGWRHHLAPEARATDVTEVARDLVALHSTDPATVFLAAAARLVDPQVAAIESALYETRNLVRLLAMRRTMWVVPAESVPLVRGAATGAIAERERRRLLQLLESSDVGNGDCLAWLTRVEQDTLAALAARGTALGAELSTDVPALRTSFTYAEGKAYGGTQNFTTQILNGMSMAGHIVRGRPRGAWNSSQYRWASVASWLPDGEADRDRDEAQEALVRAWLGSFGPGTAADLKWWTGLTMGEVKRALARIGPVEVDLDGAIGLVLPDDAEPMPPPGPWVALLPALDPTAMGWAQREWYLGDHAPLLFDRSGNIGPTVWCDGRIVGGWAQHKTGDRGGEVVFRFFEDTGSEMAVAVESAAARLTQWIGDVRVTPRFRTPLERELTG